MEIHENYHKKNKGWLIIIIGLLLLLAMVPASGLMAQEGTGVPIADQAVQSGSDDDQVVPDENGVELTPEVLIIQDDPGFGDPGVLVYAKHAIPYSKITSGQLAATDLSPYKLVVVPSDQGATLINNWNASFTKIEAYLQAGGNLWLSTGNNLDTPIFSLPGGVTGQTGNVYDGTNEVVTANHPWVRGVATPFSGTYASHDEFTNLYPGSTIVARANTTKRPVLVDYRFGAGRVLINGQMLEYMYTGNQGGKLILENSLIDMLGYRALIIRDGANLGNSHESVLQKYRVKFNVLTSGSLANINYTPYDMVVIPDGQNFYQGSGAVYNQNWNNNFAKAQAYVNAGGRLWHSTGLNSNYGPAMFLVGGATGQSNYSIDTGTVIQLPNHPWVRGLPTVLSNSSLSYDNYTNLTKGSLVVSRGQTSNLPNLVDYKYGQGRVLITGQILGYAYAYGNPGGPMLENSLIDLLGAGVVYLPALNKNFCADFGNSEVEPNNSDSQANGQLCWGKSYTGNPNNNSGGASAEDSDWFYFDWNGQGTLSVSITNYLADAQVLLYHESNTSAYVKWILPQPDKDYSFTYDGAAGAGRYYLRLFAPAGHPTDGGNYNLSVTVN